MATRRSTSTKSTAQMSKKSMGQIKRKTTNAIEAQKVINRDYKTLAKDYGVLFKKLWQIPPTKYILGGAIFTALIPVAKKFMKNYPEIRELVSENINKVEEKFDEVTDQISAKVSSMKGGNSEDLSDVNH